MASTNGSDDHHDQLDQDPGEAIDDLTRSLREALADDHPLPFLAQAASLTQALGPHAGADAPESPDPETVLSAFVGSGDRTMQAMAYAIARLAGDHHLQAEVDQRLGSEIAQLPTWLQRLDRIRPTSALQAIDPTFAGANIAVGADLDGHQLTMVGFIDFDLGSALTDAYLLDAPPEEYAQMWSLMGATSSQDPIDPADARARWEAATLIGDRTEPPYETDSWPVCRPIVELLLNTLPTGGADFAAFDLSEAERRLLISTVAASEQLGSLRTDPDLETVVDLLLDFRNEHNDPLLWSSKAVEIFLSHYAPRRLMAPREFMIKFPPVLRAVISAGLRIRNLPEEEFAEALDAVDDYGPAFEAALDQRDRIAQGEDERAAALREMLGHDRPADS